MSSPAEKYAQLLTRPGFEADPVQARVVELLQDLFERLSAQPMTQSGLDKGLGKGLWGKISSIANSVSSVAAREPVQGLYLWGGVGRGKTLLMDMFYDCLPAQRRLRLHFHRFMWRVHSELTTLTGISDPLQTVADGFAQEADVLCFDEFFVSDIGDAMLLGELLQGLFQRGVTLVATSNVAPDRLYENGLQRRRFLPAIDLIHTHAEVHELQPGDDYRLRVLTQAELYHWPLDADAEASLAKSLAALAPDRPEAQVDLQIAGRELVAKWAADDVVWFEFAQLCEGPRSQNDYIELARIYHAVLVSNVPQFNAGSEDAARRFVSLVDEFYDHSVKLIVSAAVDVRSLYAGERLRFEFERTASRLIEMQSEAYLGRVHRA